jgi:hypothetical protein
MRRNTALGRNALPGLTISLLPVLVAAAMPAACGGSSSTSPGGTGSSSGGSNGSSGGSSGASSGAGGASSGGGSGYGASGPSVSATCIVGTQGCLCDTTGGCAPGLTCTPQGSPEPNLCCTGSNCTPGAGTSHIGAVCSATSGAASCKPGITIPAATSTVDSCGYSTSDFVESTTLCAIKAVGGGSQPAVVQVYYNDEHALTLGCDTATSPVSPLSSDPGSAHYPKTGDPGCVDAVGRPLRPVLFVTDISADPTCTAGDLQKGGHPYEPIAIFGTWKSATEGSGNLGTPNADPAANNMNLGSGADPWPSTTGATADAGAGTDAGGGPKPMPMPAMMGCNQGYSAELQFEVGLISGHSYRLQVIVHDGDQNKGGDSGEACVTFCAGSGSSCPTGAQTCSNGETGAQCPSGTSCVQGCCISSDGGPPLVLTDAGVPVPP